jgi:hypothetical protein
MSKAELNTEIKLSEKKLIHFKNEEGSRWIETNSFD